MEDYKKKYEEALERARQSHIGAIKSCDSYTREYLEDIFPELKEENEDERIRKELISHFNSYKANCSSDWYGIKVNSIIAWLENQERTMHTKNSDDFIEKACDAFCKKCKMLNCRSNECKMISDLKRKESENLNNGF